MGWCGISGMLPSLSILRIFRIFSTIFQFFSIYVPFAPTKLCLCILNRYTQFKFSIKSVLPNSIITRSSWTRSCNYSASHKLSNVPLLTQSFRFGMSNGNQHVRVSHNAHRKIRMSYYICNNASWKKLKCRILIDG